jgi:hypothetical protein
MPKPTTTAIATPFPAQAHAHPARPLRLAPQPTRIGVFEWTMAIERRAEALREADRPAARVARRIGAGISQCRLDLAHHAASHRPEQHRVGVQEVAQSPGAAEHPLAQGARLTCDAGLEAQRVAMSTVSRQDHSVVWGGN